MDLNNLATFIEVARHGTISGASKDLRIPTSTISRRLNKLEDEFEARLLSRNSRHCSLTPSGQVLYDYAVGLMDDLLEAKNILRETDGQLSGRMKVSIPTEFGVVWLSDVVSEFARDHPMVDLECITSMQSLDPVRREIDVSIAYLRGAPEDSSLVMRRLLTIQSSVVAAPSLIETYGKPSTVAQMASLPCISTLSALRSNPWQFVRPDATCFALDVQSKYKVDSSNMLINGALRGLGYAIIPTEFIKPELRSGNLIELPLDFRPAPLEIVAVFPERKHITRRTRALVNAIEKSLQTKGHSFT